MSAMIRRAVFMVVVLMQALVFTSAAWAQAAEEAEPAGKNWVMSYLLVVLSIGLGLTVVCRMGMRHKDIRQDHSAEE